MSKRTDVFMEFCNRPISGAYPATFQGWDGPGAERRGTDYSDQYPFYRDDVELDLDTPGATHDDLTDRASGSWG